MTRTLVALLALALASAATSAHHSYSAYDRKQTLEIEGVLEVLEWAAPHTLLKVRADGKLYVFEWRAPVALQRDGIQRDSFSVGDRLIAAGQPASRGCRERYRQSDVDPPAGGRLQLVAMTRVSSWPSRPPRSGSRRRAA